MKISRTRLLLALGLLALAAPAVAQTKVENPDGPLPTVLVLNPKDGRPQPVWMAYEGFQPRVAPDLNSKALQPGREIKFMQMFYYAASRNEEDFHLLVTANEDKSAIKEYIGWVPGRYLVLNPKAVPDKDTGIVTKALIVNTLDSLASLNELMIRAAPRKDAPGKDEPQRLYTTLFVYGQADGFVLVGDAPSFNSRKDEDTRLVLGWLPGDRVAIWNTREAVEWDHDSTLKGADRPHYLVNVLAPDGPPQRLSPGHIYETVAAARASLDNPSTAGIFEETLTLDPKLNYMVSPKRPLGAPPFPALRKVKGERHPLAGDLYEVGGIGGLYDAKGRLVLNAEQVAKLQQQLTFLKDQQATTEILFIVDDTESMRNWFKVVASTVRKIMTLAGRDPQRHVRVAVSYYNDITEQSKEKKKPPVEASPLQDVLKEGDKILAEVDKHDEQFGGDPNEMVFRGIFEGIDKAGFQAQSRKLVVVIGDCGDISAVPGRMAADPEYAKKYNIPAIIDRLVPEDLSREAPIEFYAVQVIDPDQDQAAKDFHDQMLQIKDRYGERLRERTKKQRGEGFKEADFHVTADYFAPAANRSSEVEASLAVQYDRMAQEAKDIEELITRLKKGQWVNTKVTPELEQQINKRLAEISGDRRVTLDDLRRSGGVQLFKTGFVWEKTKDGLPQVNELVLLNEKELSELIELLKNFDPDGEGSVSDIVADVIAKQANTGDQSDPQRTRNLALKDLLKLGTGLMFQFSVMNKKLFELKGDRGAIEDDEYFLVLHRKDLLEDAKGDKALQYKKESRDRAGVKVPRYVREGAGRDEPRHFYFSDNEATRWFYIDYKKEWP